MDSKIIDPLVEAYIKSMCPPSIDFLEDLETLAEKYGIPIVQKETAQFLKVITEIAKPKSVLEIGTAIGYSASLFALSMGNGYIDTIERNEKMVDRASETFKNLENEKMTSVTIKVHFGEANEILSSLDKSYDLIFIDASKSHYQSFLDLSLPKLNDEGILICDNILYKGMIASDEYVVKRKKTIVKNMRNYLNVLMANEDFTTSILPIGDGLSVSKRRRK